MSGATHTAVLTPWRRAAVLAVLALAFGLIGERSMQRREAAVARELGPPVQVVALARDVPAGRELTADDLVYVDVPERYVAPQTLTDGEAVLGLRLVAAARRGTPVLAPLVTSTEREASSALASGDRVMEFVAGGSTRLVRVGGTVDVVAARVRGDGEAGSEIVASAAEVLDVRSVDAADGDARVSVTVRVNRTQALGLTTALGEEATLRLLPRATWQAGGGGGTR